MKARFCLQLYSCTKCGSLFHSVFLRSCTIGSNRFNRHWFGLIRLTFLNRTLFNQFLTKHQRSLPKLFRPFQPGLRPVEKVDQSNQPKTGFFFPVEHEKSNQPEKVDRNHTRPKTFIFLVKRCIEVYPNASFYFIASRNWTTQLAVLFVTNDNKRPVFQPIRSKPKSNRDLNFALFPALGVVCMFFVTSSDSFIVIVV